MVVLSLLLSKSNQLTCKPVYFCVKCANLHVTSSSVVFGESEASWWFNLRLRWIFDPSEIAGCREWSVPVARTGDFYNANNSMDLWKKYQRSVKKLIRMSKESVFCHYWEIIPSITTINSPFSFVCSTDASRLDNVPRSTFSNILVRSLAIAACRSPKTSNASCRKLARR